MANTIEFGMAFRILRYVIAVIISLIVLRHVFRLVKSSLMTITLNNFCMRANAHLKPDLFESMKQLQKEVNPNGKLRILEAGAGAGPNFKFFPKNSQVIALDPDESCGTYLKENVNKFEDVELLDVIHGRIEDLSTYVRDASVDAVVCTYVLCSVDDPEGAMRQIMRVLKPNGRFYFMEHVTDSSRNSWTHIVQRLVYPLQLALFDCDCLKETSTYIDKAGFRSHTYRLFSDSTDMPIFLQPTMLGYATK